MGVGHHQPHALQAALDQRAQKPCPEGLVLTWTAVHAEHPALTLGRDADRHHARNRHHPVELSYFVEGRIEDHIGALVLDWAGAKRINLVVERLAQPADLGLRDAVDPQRLDEIIDLARAHALDVGLDHDRVQRSLGAPTRLEQAREIGAARDLGDLELDGADPSVPGAGPVAVSIGAAVRAALVGQSADLRADLGLHHRLGEDPHTLAQGVDVILLEQLADEAR
jgi:hypothetical protein